MVEAEELNTFIGVPVRAGDEIVAVMNILTRYPDVLDEEELTLINAIGTHVGSSIRNARLFDMHKHAENKIRQKNEELTAANEELNAALEELENINEELEQTNEEFEAQNEELIESYKSLAKNEKLYRSLFETNKAILLLIDPESGNIKDANFVACRFYGYSREEVLSMKIMDINQLSEKEVSNQMQRAKLEKKLYFEFKHRLASGEIRDVDVYSGPVHVKGSNYLYSIIHDVTDRKKTEEKLQKSEEKYRSLIETTSDWIWEVDVNGIYTYSSPQVKDILGYEPEEIIGKTLFDFMQPDESKRVGDLFKSFVAGHKPIVTVENIAIHRNGQLVVLETSGNSVFDIKGNLTGYRGIDRDITDRKKMEKALNDSFKTFQLVLENIDAIVYISDIHTYKILYLNKTARLLFGDSVGKICYKALQKDKMSPCDFCTNDKLVNNNGKPAEGYNWEFNNTFNNRWYAISDRAIKWIDGRIVRLEIAYDITERKQSEDYITSL